jgi:cell division protein FtsL
MDKKDESLIVSTRISRIKTIVIIISVTFVILLAASTIVLAILYKSKKSDYDDLKTDYKNINNQYQNQNSSINDVFKNVHDLIANTTMPTTQIKKEDYKDIKQKFEVMKNFSDGTYDYISQELITYQNGYSVGFETRSRAYDNYYTDAEYDNIVYKIAALLGTNADLGVFGKMPQISFYIENLDLALAVAAVFNQQSIWDWSKGEILVNVMHQPKYY